MPHFDIREWVNQSPQHLAFRQAVHIILLAISKSPSLQESMIMKGGILLALGYDSSRYTKDVDFSTAVTLSEFDPNSFRRDFEASLARAVDQLGYDLDCLMQSCKQKPQGSAVSFPTIRIKVGYAKKSDASAHRRLLRKNSSQVVQVDYSLNEPAGDPQLIEIQDGHSIRTYSFHDLIGEKFRALLQQEVRDRFRRQDIYDLHFVLENHLDRNDRTLKEKILKSQGESFGKEPFGRQGFYEKRRNSTAIPAGI